MHSLYTRLMATRCAGTVGCHAPAASRWHSTPSFTCSQRRGGSRGCWRGGDIASVGGCGRQRAKVCGHGGANGSTCERVPARTSAVASWAAATTTPHLAHQRRAQRPREFIAAAVHGGQPFAARACGDGVCAERHTCVSPARAAAAHAHGAATAGRGRGSVFAHSVTSPVRVSPVPSRAQRAASQPRALRLPARTSASARTRAADAPSGISSTPRTARIETTLGEAI